MADLATYVARGFGRMAVMPQPAGLVVSRQDVVRLSDVASASMGLIIFVNAEALHLSADAVTRILGNTGQVAFNASPDQASITSYTARVRDVSDTIVATQSLGVPTPDGNNVIVVDLSTTFGGLAAGNYTVSILATSSGGSTDSAESSSFALPLS